MRAYYFDNIEGDQRAPHDSGRVVQEDVLKRLGLLHWTIPYSSDGSWEEKINEIAKERDYKNRDTINITKQGLGDLYETKIKSFFEEYERVCFHTLCVPIYSQFLDTCMRMRRFVTF
jgi:1,2-dihydroxy-3-keto-5-methylthiopentene dioxygenase